MQVSKGVNFVCYP